MHRFAGLHAAPVTAQYIVSAAVDRAPTGGLSPALGPRWSA
jgi:hypothetical protein